MEMLNFSSSSTPPGTICHHLVAIKKWKKHSNYWSGKVSVHILVIAKICFFLVSVLCCSSQTTRELLSLFLFCCSYSDKKGIQSNWTESNWKQTRHELCPTTDIPLTLNCHRMVICIRHVRFLCSCVLWPCWGSPGEASDSKILLYTCFRLNQSPLAAFSCCRGRTGCVFKVKNIKLKVRLTCYEFLSSYMG